MINSKIIVPYFGTNLKGFRDIYMEVGYKKKIMMLSLYPKIMIKTTKYLRRS
jgi:hypothetical protein